MLFLWDWRSWWIAVVILLSHYIIDLAKLYANDLTTKTWPFFIDQSLHILVIALLTFPASFLGDVVDWAGQINFWTIALGFVFIMKPTGIIIGKLLQPFTNQIKDTLSLSKAGRMIGYLERFLIVVFILNGRWEAIGFLITAKSVFRFKDIKENNHELTEYYLIGTLLSFGIAITVGWLMKIVF